KNPKPNTIQEPDKTKNPKSDKNPKPNTIQEPDKTKNPKPNTIQEPKPKLFIIKQYIVQYSNLDHYTKDKTELKSEIINHKCTQKLLPV
ncbi:MAG: hypothetical protein ACPLET_05910, partial [Methanothermobacter tenebrarum]